jgi:soluble lytic murein transglycosylase
LAASALPARAEIKIELRPDGRRVMVNNGRAALSSTLPAATAAGFPAVPAAARPAAARSGIRHAVARDRYLPLVEAHSGRYGLDPRLVLAVVEVESAYRPDARSHKGAMGLMQLMPATAAGLDVDDPYDPDQNLRGGTAYLARMVERFGTLELALAAYNAGPEAVERYDGVPPYRETREYVERVLALYHGREVTLPGASGAPRGRKPYIVREADGRMVLTTDPSP